MRDIFLNWTVFWTPRISARNQETELRLSRKAEAVEPRARQHSSRLHRGRKHLDSRGDFSVCLSLQQISNNHAGPPVIGPIGPELGMKRGFICYYIYVICVYATCVYAKGRDAGKESSSNDRTEGPRLVPFQFRRAPLHNELFPCLFLLAG